MYRAAWLVVCASCVSSTSVLCEDGSTCPGGFQCDVANHRCLVPEQIAACDGKAEGDACTFNDAPGACRDGACEVFFCGDGYVTGNEACDGENLGIDPLTGMTADCKTVDFYGVDGLACNNACNYETAGCEVHGWCGDAVVNGPEICDGSTNLTCVEVGFDAGSVTCNSSCALGIVDCSRFGWTPESLSDVIALGVAGTSHTDQWAVGQNGRAMHYEGAFWNTVPTNVQNTLIRAWAVAKNNVWAVGQSRTSPALPSVVIHWNGNAWSTVSGVPAGEYVDVWAASATAVYVATTGSILRFDGSAWSTVGSFSGQPIAIRGSSPSDIWVATNAGPLVHWDGATWSPSTLTGVAVKFIDANAMNDVWVAGSLSANLGTGVIAHYDGATWTQWTNPQEIYNAIASSAPNDAWVAGVDGIMRHFDGVAWSNSTNIGASPSGLAALSGLLSLGADEVVGVSTLNLAYRYRGQAFGVYRPLGINPFDAIENTALWGTAANDLFVTNVNGEVWHYDGAWSKLFTVAATADVAATSIWGAASNDVWVAANDGRVYHYIGTWTPEDVSPTTALQKVWGIGSDVWAFGTAGAFHRTATGWDRFALSDRAVRSVSGSSNTDIYVVEAGAPNKLWHWNGIMWSEVSTSASFEMLAVIAIAPDDVHVSEREGRMLHWNGNAWSETIVPALADVEFLAASAADDVVAASERDLFHYDGKQWSPMRPPIDFVPNTLDYIPMIGLQVFPGRIEMLLKRYRIRTLLRTRPLTCRTRETCGDAVDNDCDNLLDSVDTQDCP